MHKKSHFVLFFEVTNESQQFSLGCSSIGSIILLMCSLSQCCQTALTSKPLCHPSWSWSSSTGFTGDTPSSHSLLVSTNLGGHFLSLMFNSFKGALIQLRHFTFTFQPNLCGYLNLCARSSFFIEITSKSVLDSLCESLSPVKKKKTKMQCSSS